MTQPSPSLPPSADGPSLTSAPEPVADPAVPPPGFAPYPVWLVPAWPQNGAGPGAMVWPMPPQAPPAPLLPAPIFVDTAAAHNQRLLILGIVGLVMLVHLPWLLYLLAVHGCWGGFVDLCAAAPVEEAFDSLSDTPFMFAGVAFFILRVQSVLSDDWAQFSQVMQVSTGLGSFFLTKIIAANGKITQGNVSRMLLAGTCAAAFVVLFWAEIHLTGTSTYPELGDQTVLGYIDQELPEDFVSAVAAKSGLMQYLQILRLADALILGAALAMPKSTGKAP